MANKCKRGILISKTPYEKRIAIMEDGELAELVVEGVSSNRVLGNIYKGVVQKVLPALKAAFIDIGLEKAGFLHQEDAMDRNELLRREYGDDDDEGDASKEISIDEILQEGQEIMVQVVKEPISTKGARLTTHLSFAGRFLVCMPGTNFVGVSKRIETALGMSGAVIFVMTLASFVTALFNRFLVTQTFTINGQTVDLSFTRILLFIVVIAALVQIVEILLKKFSPSLYVSLGIYLPLITTNCAVLGAAELNADASRGLISSTVFGFSTGVGFGLALLLFASIRERLAIARIPKAMEGTAIALVTAGILAMAFMGFSGLVK